MRCHLAWGIALALVACDGGGRSRDALDPEDAAQRADAETDASPHDAAVTDGALSDVGVDAAPDAEVDAAPDMDAPDAAPLPEVCDGDDDDGDGLVDEGATNICGGCGGLPPEGYQAWRVQLLRNAGGETDTGRVVGLAGGILAVSERRIEGGDCEFVRAPAQHPDAHLGIVNVDAPTVMLNQVPTYDARSGTHRYSNSPDLGVTRVFGDGDALRVRAGGGRQVGRFEADIVAPAGLSGVGGDDLAPLAALARGTSAEAAELRWDPAPDRNQAGELRLFVGGSVSVFNRNVYRAIRHYELDATLDDDGSLRLTSDFFTSVPGSSVWVHLTRGRSAVRSLGAHGLEISVGQRVEHRASGGEGDSVPPFEILAPDPNDRRITPGEPLEVRWTALPAIGGALVVTLTLVDGANLETRRLSCRADDPAAGRLVLPAEATESWPAAPDDLRQLTVSWDQTTSDLPAPDSGRLTQTVSLLLRLEP